ncbi:MAG: hypothetical protein QXL89_05845 [Nitrososphaeria archaeon]
MLTLWRQQILALSSFELGLRQYFNLLITIIFKISLSLIKYHKKLDLGWEIKVSVVRVRDRAIAPTVYHTVNVSSLTRSEGF